jgi:acetoin utilization deacetylase AcuC-like enzyme
MKIFYSETQCKHFPPFEVFDGGKRVPYLESPKRMDRILTALNKADWAELVEPADFGLDPILAVHDQAYISFLASCWTEWLASDPEVAAAPEAHAFLPATFALRRNPRVPRTLLGKAGYYIMDLSACIVDGTYIAALASANCALSAAQFISSSTVNRPSSAFALCRPPGHRELAFVKRQGCHIRHRLPRGQRHPGYLLRTERCADHLHSRRPRL